MNRRTLLASLASVVGGLLLVLGTGETEAGPRARRHRRRVRRRIRRRHRRRAVRRIVNGRPVWVVPVGLAVGWELAQENRVVLVQETRIVEREGVKVEIAVVQGDDGGTSEIEIVREDTATNRKELEGSALADGDATTPGVEVEIEVDE